ncbi:MAG: PocR ligand-binding domain-containing protein [Ignavibacteria bacterium]
MEEGILYVDPLPKQKTNILIVEDSSIVAMQIKHLLTNMDYNVLGIVSTGEMAIERASKNRIDLVLMDIRLEGKIDGIETAMVLKDKYNLPVIYLTAYSDDNTFSRAKETDPFGYILKPFESKELKTAVEIALFKHGIEKKLKQSEELYRTLVENTHDGILIIYNGKIEFANDAFTQMLDYEPGQVIAMEFFELLDKEQLSILDGQFRKIIDNSTTKTEYELTFIKKDNYNTVVTDTNFNAIDYHGKRVVICTVKDITEQKKAQEVLKRSEESLRAKLDYFLSTRLTIDDINLAELIELEKLQKIQDIFANTFGVASVITDVNGNLITEPSNFSNLCKMIRSNPVGKQKCTESDKLLGEMAKKGAHPVQHSCAACGLMNAATPMFIGERHLANWMVGQINCIGLTEDKITEFAIEINADPVKLAEEFKKVKTLDEQSFQNIVNMMWIYSQEISSLAYNNLLLKKELFEKKRTENDLFKSEVKNEAILKAIPDSLFEIKPDGSYKCLQLSNISENYFLGRFNDINSNIINDFPKGIAELMLKNVKKAILTHSFRKFEFSYEAPDQTHYYEVRVALIENDETLVMIRDITDKKNSEAELIKAKDEAESSDRLKSEFLAQISHEIRTPINAILSFSSLLKEELEEQLTGGLADSFKIIDKAGRRLIRTIDEILEMSQLQTGNYEINISKISLAQEVLNSLLRQFNYQAKESHVDLKFENRLKEDAVVSSDRFMVTQIFTNLIDNAIKYTPEGQIEVIQYKNAEDKICVDVTDTGIGISEEFIPKLFSPFLQEDAGYTRRFEGNGLGLAIIKRYADLNNIQIRVKSRKGFGSCFTVIFG